MQKMKNITIDILTIIEIFLFFMLGSDCDNTLIFIISKIINILLFFIIAIIIDKLNK